jgi:fumarate hydratase, class II
MGYDRPVGVGRLGLAENLHVKQAAEKLGYVRPEQFDRRAAPAQMTRPCGSPAGGGD